MNIGKIIGWKKGIGTATLDQISDNFGIQPNLIKIDIDGNELKVLKGGHNTFTNPKMRSIIVEMIEDLPDYLKIKRYLDSHGFILLKNIGDNQIWSRQ